MQRYIKKTKLPWTVIIQGLTSFKDTMVDAKSENGVLQPPKRCSITLIDEVGEYNCHSNKHTHEAPYIYIYTYTHIYIYTQIYIYTKIIKNSLQ